MAEIGVSTEVLREVKNSLDMFQEMISGMSNEAQNVSNDCINECNCVLRENSRMLEGLEHEIKKLEDKITEVNRRMRDIARMTEMLKKTIESFENMLGSLEQQLDYHENRLDLLNEKLNECYDEESEQRIREQIRDCKEDIFLNRQKQSKVQSEIRQSKDLIDKKDKELYELHGYKSSLESEHSVQKQRYIRQREKIDSLKSISSSIQSDAEAYVRSMKLFETSAIEDVERKEMAISRCIHFLEDYLSMN